MEGDNEFGLWLRKRRLERRLTQGQLADLADLSRRWLVEIEAGRAEPTFSAGLRLIDALDADLTDVPGLFRYRSRARLSTNKLEPEEADTNRRELLQGVLAVLAGADLMDVERLLVPTADAPYLETAQAVTTGFLSQWYAASPAALLPPVLAHVRALQQALPGPQELESLTGRTALLAGHLFAKVDRPPDARASYALAESLARDSGDTDLLAVVLVLWSGLHSWRRTSDRRRSFKLVSEAAATISTASPPLLRTLVLARMAEEHAAVGDADEFEQHMAQAEAAVRPGDHWYGPRDAAELAAIRGTSELLLGRRRQAAETLTWTLARLDSSAVNWRAVIASDRDRALAPS
jgi:transcriptional regulator with XRE-family HTH domain